MSNSSVIDGDLYSSMSESEKEDIENSFFEGGESSCSVHDAQYCDDIIGEHVYKPDVPVQLIPFKGLIFKPLKLAIKRYFEYAEIGGFDVRLSMQSRFDNKIIKKKHVICNHGGKQKKKSCDTLEKEFIVHASTSTMAHKLRASLRGGYEFINPKVVDYKNLRRDINRVIGYKDAQMIVNTMNDCQAQYPNYSFEFNCQDDVLDCMFWADEMEKTYYAEFGDVISFDATFRTNKKRFSKLVWDINMKPDVFEVKRVLLMKEFNLEDTRWFKDTLTIRDSWIPRYFSDIPMCGLMKTTSRSERMNSFFNTYSESGNLLLNFMMNYDTAIQKQMNTQRELDKASKKASYKMQRPREIELQTSKVEIKVEEKEINCSCEHFKGMGVLCRHAFTIMMRCGVKEIPERNLSDYISAGLKSKTNGEVVCKLLGVTIPIPEEINIHVLEVQSNKGSGINKRISSAGEVAYENSKKEHRMCSGCGKRVPHNLRTCPERVGAAKLAKDS
uniref:SWIM-type domain-containing protein n=1 Tax=Lactuca sativa TaxID=4236 RepID=A0A9R1VK69_LACSA|nr:hypothetical protein LSAT_V11C500290040 [Lactuca sativa]